jgi:hypothetical protein
VKTGGVIKDIAKPAAFMQNVSMGTQMPLIHADYPNFVFLSARLSFFCVLQSF